ncbi:MAG: VOC family protein [Armatimonadetes bacterium]|nr:VOC family protein [Armatimonadota bacterium]
MPNFEFEGGLTAAYNVSDVKRSIDWYQDVLGFKVQYHLEEMGWCEMETHIPKVSAGLSQVENPEVKGGPTLTWGVTDIDAARSELEAKGVKFDGETTEIPEMVKLATFFDPDGNHLMLYQSLMVTA